MKVNSLTIGGKKYEVIFNWRTMMEYENATGRNISVDMQEIKMSFISQIFAAALLEFQRYKKEGADTFETALSLLENFSNSDELATFNFEVTTYFLESLPKPKEDVKPNKKKVKVK